MGYRERPLSPRPTLHIDGTEYDVDFFGMDDGMDADPSSALRFMFQLGDGFMIHLYVIQAGARGRPGHFFHTLWLKDCAVAHVDEEDRGPPSQVTVERLDLPLNFTMVTLRGRAYQVFTIRSQTFTASHERGEQHLAMQFALDALDGDGHAAPAGELRWTRHHGWALALDGRPRRPLAADEWLEFTPPS